jgi:hypothetical protein
MKGEFIGGSDIAMEMRVRCRLKQLLDGRPEAAHTYLLGPMPTR